MDFQWNINHIFKSYISKINYTLLPSDFSGDRKTATKDSSRIAEIIDTMGIASAKAQGLQHSMTNAEELKNLDQLVYLMIEPKENNNKGSVVGLLKIGVKNLFLHDETGRRHEKKSLCVLDFYIHESKQRSGFGKKLYDYMLFDKNIKPCKLAIDKPSVNFLLFLHKHYNLEKIYPQNNNFVVFEGFFDGDIIDANQAMSSLDHQSQGSLHDHDHDNTPQVQSEDYIANLYGRHTAFKRIDTMGKIVDQGYGTGGQGGTEQAAPM